MVGVSIHGSHLEQHTYNASTNMTFKVTFNLVNVYMSSSYLM